MDTQKVHNDQFGNDKVSNYKAHCQSLSHSQFSPIKSLYCNDDRISHLIPSFLSRLKSQSIDLEQLMLDEDMILTKKMLHKLKGGCGSYGFPALYDALFQLEATLAAKGFSGGLLFSQFLHFKKMIDRVEA